MRCSAGLCKLSLKWQAGGRRADTETTILERYFEHTGWARVIIQPQASLQGMWGSVEVIKEVRLESPGLLGCKWSLQRLNEPMCGYKVDTTNYDT
jgi:hypothetical protein